MSCCHFFRVTFIAVGGPKYQHDNGFMHVHSPYQYLILTYMWYMVAHGWNVSRGCFKDWRFCEYRNVSWGSTPDFEGSWFEILMLIMNNIQQQVLEGKSIYRRPLVYPSDLYARERSFVPVCNVMEEKWCENLTSQGLQLNKQITTNSITLSYACKCIKRQDVYRGCR